MSGYLLGIDCGLTVTKAVVFDAQGRAIGSGAVRTPQDTPHPHWVERDMERLWRDCAEAIRAALAQAGAGGADIAGIGATAHGDGLYLVDEEGRPVRAGILSLDSRAVEIIDAWRQSGVLDEALQLTGQQPFAAAPAAVLAWLARYEPEALQRARYALACKDWIKLKLTGHIAADPTEASVSFTDVRTQRYCTEAFALYGLQQMEGKVAPVVGSTDVAGEVTSEAAAATGLRPGTPVVSGLHDVDASAVGSGCVHPGQISVIAGTYSINQTISTSPLLNASWACRNFVEPGQWMNMSISPASATNLEWFVQELCPLECERARAAGRSPFDEVNEQVQAVLDEPSRVFFHPFLYGSPYGARASAGFFGLRGWHSRGHLLRAIYEGVCFNHRTHVDALRSAFPCSEVRLTGGGARSGIWCQIFADALGLAVRVPETQEAGALGTAICAGVGCGISSSLEQAVGQMVRIARTYEPDQERHARLSAAYNTYVALANALAPLWQRMEGGADG